MGHDIKYTTIFYTTILYVHVVSMWKGVWCSSTVWLLAINTDMSEY